MHSWIPELLTAIGDVVVNRRLGIAVPMKSATSDAVSESGRCSQNMCSTRVRRAFVSHSGCRGTRQMRPAVGDPTSLSTPAPADQLAASGERQWVGTGSYFTVAISGSYYRTDRTASRETRRAALNRPIRVLITIGPRSTRSPAHDLGGLALLRAIELIPRVGTAVNAP